MESVIEPLPYIRKWSIDRINLIMDENEENDSKKMLDALSIAEEFDEWINIEEEQEIEYLSIKNQDWVENELD